MLLRRLPSSCCCCCCLQRMKSGMNGDTTAEPPETRNLEFVELAVREQVRNCRQLGNHRTEGCDIAGTICCPAVYDLAELLPTCFHGLVGDLEECAFQIGHVAIRCCEDRPQKSKVLVNAKPRTL